MQLCCSTGDLKTFKKVYTFKSQKRKRKGREGGRGGRKRAAVDEGVVGHSGYVLALAVSSDGVYLVSGL